MKTTLDAPKAVSIGDFLGKNTDFSLVLGGPLFQLLRGSHLSDDALGLLRQRILLFSLFSWLPLLLLSAVEGHLFDGSAAVPFARDFDVHIRFLIAMPLLIVAELVVHKRTLPIVQQFLERNIIQGDAVPRFAAAIKSAVRLRNSIAAELALIAFVYIVGIVLIWRHYLALETSTWYATPSAEGTRLSFAGMWYGFISLPFFQFLLCRWYFRWFIWTRFLWQVSRIELSLVPTHPDRVGGLGFLSSTIYAFAVLAGAHGALLSGLLANRILYLKDTLPGFLPEIIVLVLFMLFLCLGPLLVFAPQLTEARRTGLLEYGTLAERYVREFETKWVRGGAPADEQLLGSADVQSLADLSNSVEVVRTMRAAPFTKDDILRLVATTLAPIVPLLLTMMPLGELLKTLFGVLF
jgi:hypothetical protein